MSKKIHNGAGGHFGFTPLEKMPGFLRGTLGLNIFKKVQGSEINHQNILARKWSLKLGFSPYYYDGWQCCRLTQHVRAGPMSRGTCHLPANMRRWANFVLPLAHRLRAGPAVNQRLANVSCLLVWALV